MRNYLHLQEQDFRSLQPLHLESGLRLEDHLVQRSIFARVLCLPQSYGHSNSKDRELELL